MVSSFNNHDEYTKFTFTTNNPTVISQKPIISMEDSFDSNRSVVGYQCDAVSMSSCCGWRNYSSNIATYSGGSSDSYTWWYIFGITIGFAFLSVLLLSRRKKEKVSQHFNVYTNEVVQRKIDFQRRVGACYGYTQSCSNGFIDEWRYVELPGLIPPIIHQRHNKKGIKAQIDMRNEPEIYLDYAGSALPVASQLYELAQTHILANPHSTGPAASRTLNLLEQAKKRILDHFDAHPGRLSKTNTDRQPLINDNNHHHHPGYDLIFTSGATESLRIVAERFPWSRCTHCPTKSMLVYPTQAHTSVVGMRGVALASGQAEFVCHPIQTILTDIKDGTISCYCRIMSKKGSHLPTDMSCSCDVRNLLVLPLECNFSGDRYDVTSAFDSLSTHHNQADNSQQLWYTMLDIAKAASTGPVSLRTLNPDFACLSFYKMFGVPTGLGCLLVKRSAINILVKTTTTSTTDLSISSSSDQLRDYFGGGSVDVVLPGRDFAVRRSNPSLMMFLNNGTIHFRGIASLLVGFRELDRLGGMRVIQSHTLCLTIELVRRFRKLRHDNGRTVVCIYGDWCTYDVENTNNATFDHQHPGPTVAFNMIRADGSFVGYNEVSKLAALNRPPIQLRTGCFCNPGACQIALGITDEETISNYKESGHVCGDHIDILRGRPTGAIRASFGKDSLWEDLETLVVFLEKFFVRKIHNIARVKKTAHFDGKPWNVIVSELYIFPIKSCSAQRVYKWQMAPSNGRLRFDREFAIVDSSGTAMRLRDHPRMALVQPEINLAENKMIVRASGHPDLEILLNEMSEKGRRLGTIDVCGNCCNGDVWGEANVSDWFSNVLGVQCWLARHSSESDVAQKRNLTARRDVGVAFANEQPLLLISEHAVETLNAVLLAQGQKSINSRQFRPNIVVRLNRTDCTDSIAHHVEDEWKTLQALESGMTFDVVGPCARCSMVDIDPTGGNNSNTLRALAEYRRNKGKITFGIFLRGKKILSDSRGINWVKYGDHMTCR